MHYRPQLHKCFAVHRRSVVLRGNLLCLAFVLLACQALLAQVSVGIGDVKATTVVKHGVELNLTNAKVSITAYTPQIIRVRCVQNDVAQDVSYAVVKSPGEANVQSTETADEVRVSTDSLTVVISKKPFRIQLLNKSGKHLCDDDSRLGITWQGTEVSCYKKLHPGERFVGLGEKTGSLDRRGGSFVNWNTDHYAYGVNDDPLYVSTPFFIGVHEALTYGIFFDNSYRTKFDFGASNDNTAYSFSAVAGEMNYYFIGNSTVAGILNSYGELTGKANIPPLWSLGYQQCRWSYYPDTQVMALARTFREKRIPADVIYLDIHYMDAYKIFTWHPDRFSRPKTMLDSLKEMGFHVVTIVDPGIKIENGYFAHDEGVKNDYFIKYPGGQKYIGEVWPGRCYFPDFTNDTVRAWWGASFSHLTEPGVEGFWNDMNEPAVWGQNIPDLVEVNFEGKKSTMREAHNIYGMEMARSTYEGTKALLHGNRPFVLTRAAYSGIQRYSAVWTGDNVPSDEHMMLAVRLVNSMGLSGIPFTGSDIGGFAGDPTPELFSRWLSIGTYTPFFRNHKQNGMRQQEPWSFGEQVEETSRRSIEERYRLLPYIYSTFYETTRNGLPVARSLAIDFTFDEKVYDGRYQHEYLFGKNILVAPVKSKEEYADVYFPEGGWYRQSNDQYYEGKRSAVVRAPIDDLPVFVRAGAIIPKQSVAQYTLDRRSDTLELHLYSGNGTSSFTYYEDDGLTFEYENGKFCKREINANFEAHELTIGNAEGTYPSRFNDLKIIPHGFAKVMKVSLNGTALRVSNRNEATAKIIPGKMTFRW